jgi:hypothetical protein
MAQLPIDLIKPFLPPGVAPSARPAPLPRSGFDREADPRVRDDRALGDYGYKVLDSIYKDYGQQIAVWKNAFKEVTAAYATAVGMRNKTFEAVQAERKAEAEAHAAVLGFVFSLMTAGSMVCLGAWVQYKLVPGLVTRTAKWDFSKGISSVPGLTTTTAEKFTKMQAAMFGGIIKDAGKDIVKAVGGKIDKYLFPEPKRITFPMDQPSVAANMDADFSKLVDESAEVVLRQIKDVQIWMYEGTEFGEAWARRAGGHLDRARMEIRLHIDALRQEWANEWQFFGKTPNKIQRTFLAEQYERGMYAEYVVNLFDHILEATRRAPRYRNFVAELDKAGLDTVEELSELEENMSQGFGHHTWVERALVNRLKELNIVFAEKTPGKLDQANRMIEGEPRPEVHIKGAVNRGHDIEEIYGWASFFMTGARDQTAHRFFPPAQSRALDPLPSYA